MSGGFDKKNNEIFLIFLILILLLLGDSFKL
jgi:hypothetical protein